MPLERLSTSTYRVVAYPPDGSEQDVGFRTALYVNAVLADDRTSSVLMRAASGPPSWICPPHYYLPVWNGFDAALDTMRWLLANGENPNAHGAGGETALHRAVKYWPPDDTRALEALINAGAEPAARADDGTTPLLISVANAKPCFARVLVERGGYDSGAVGSGLYSRIFECVGTALAVADRAAAIVQAPHRSAYEENMFGNLICERANVLEIQQVVHDADAAASRWAFRRAWIGGAVATTRACALDFACDDP